MDNKDVYLTVEYENLAVPEVHTGKVKNEAEEPEKKEHHMEIKYDNVAIPEIRIKK